MSGEKLTENLAQQRDEREREAYRLRLAEKEATRDNRAARGGAFGSAFAYSASDSAISTSLANG